MAWLSFHDAAFFLGGQLCCLFLWSSFVFKAGLFCLALRPGFGDFGGLGFSFSRASLFEAGGAARLFEIGGSAFFFWWVPSFCSGPFFRLRWAARLSVFGEATLFEGGWCVSSLGG